MWKTILALLAASVLVIAVPTLAAGEGEPTPVSTTEVVPPECFDATAENHKALTRRAWKHFRVKASARARHRTMVRCADPATATAMIARWRAARKAHHHRFIWEYRWYAEPRSWRSWAVSTGSCESGNNPRTATGNGFYGAFQYVLSTWASAPLSPGGNPTSYSWTVQAVVSIELAQRDGTGHWPNCG